MTYIANSALRVGRGDTVVTLRPGDPVPEAAEWAWQVRHQYLDARRILDVPDASDASSDSDTPSQPTAPRARRKE